MPSLNAACFDGAVKSDAINAVLGCDSQSTSAVDVAQYGMHGIWLDIVHARRRRLRAH